MKFRDLTAAEIECRVATVNEKGCSLLLYKDARCDMNILDEEVGAENWQREHYECKGNLFCRVGIRCNLPLSGAEELDMFEWIWKSDCGAESYTEKEKGEASDSFKRACFNWGIGRELYTAPFIWIGENDVRIKEKNGIYKTKDKFSVARIKIEEKKITELTIRNDSLRRVVFDFPKGIEAPKLQDKELIICTECGKPIETFIDNQGMFWSEDKIVDFSFDKYGKILCKGCMKNAKQS